MWALAKKKTQSRDYLYFTVKVGYQKLSKDYDEVTPTTGMLLIWAHIVDPFQKLRSIEMWVKAMDMNPEDETSYTTQYQDIFLKYVENEYCGKHRWMSVIEPENVPHRNNFHSAEASGYGQLSFDAYDLSSNYEEYLTHKSVTETTRRWNDCAAWLSTAARLYLNSPPEVPTNWR